MREGEGEREIDRQTGIEGRRERERKKKERYTDRQAYRESGRM